MCERPCVDFVAAKAPRECANLVSWQAKLFANDANKHFWLKAPHFVSPCKALCEPGAARIVYFAQNVCSHLCPLGAVCSPECGSSLIHPCLVLDSLGLQPYPQVV